MGDMSREGTEVINSLFHQKSLGLHRGKGASYRSPKTSDRWDSQRSFIFLRSKEECDHWASNGHILIKKIKRKQRR